MQLNYRQIGFIGISNYFASGSTLLHSLFDGHPEVTSTPLIELQDVATLIPKQPAGTSFQERFVEIINHKKLLIDTRAPGNEQRLANLGDHQNEFIRVEPNALFQRTSHHFNAITHLPLPQRFCLAISLGWEECLGKDVSQTRWLLFPSHSLPRFFIHRFADPFVRIKHINSLRDPKQAIISGNRHGLTTRADYQSGHLAGTFQALYLRAVLALKISDMTYNMPIHDAHQDRCRGVRLEDLHQRQEATMRSLCDWVGVSWHECLLRSTVGGKKWWNRNSLIRLSGTSKDNGTKRYGDEWGDDFDRWRLAILTKLSRQKWGYAPVRFQSFPGIDRLNDVLIWAFPFRIERKEFSQGAFIPEMANEIPKSNLAKAVRTEITILNKIPHIRRYSLFESTHVKHVQNLLTKRTEMTLSFDPSTLNIDVDVKPIGEMSEGEDKISIQANNRHYETLSRWQKLGFKLYMTYLKLKYYAPIYLQSRKMLHKCRSAPIYQPGADVDYLKVP